jgi:allophanate hydrolase
VNNLTMTIPSIHKAYAGGAKPMDIIETVFQRIEEVNDPGIFITLFDKADVLLDGEKLGVFDPDLPLWGVPFVIKDNIDAKGYETTAACPEFAYVAKEDAFVVAELKKAGAILIGKTNLDQFATGLVGVRTPYGAPLNAVDPEIVPGGSSGGSGVAVGHGIVPFSLGTDTAGSGRVPAALNNIVGLKPTLGALSATGVVPACKSIETVSIFALTVEDAYAAFRVANSYDAEDTYARHIENTELTKPKPDLKVGIPSKDSIQFMGDAAQEKSFYASVELLKEQGYGISEIDFTPLYEIAQMLYYGSWVAERYTVIEELLKTNPDAIYPVTKKIISLAEERSAADAFRGFYKLKELIRNVEPELSEVDVLCVPTIPTFYSVEDLEADPVTPNNNFGTYTNFVNLMDMCGIAVPTPAREDRRPGSVTILAGKDEDALVASVATSLECVGERKLGATDCHFSEKTELPASKPTTIDIAVCGAHMSGLPLNNELTSRGATFLRAAKSAADYKFYALAGGPPSRPGMVKCAKGAGSEIELEIWSMPIEEFGGFMKTIPAPLGIGSVSLSDGSQVNGFICEAAGAEGGEDITHLGDWRHFLQSK